MKNLFRKNKGESLIQFLKTPLTGNPFLNNLENCREFLINYLIYKGTGELRSTFMYKNE